MADNTGGLDPQAAMHEIRTRVRGGGPVSGAASSHAPADAELADLFHLADIDVPRDVRTHRPLLAPYVRFRRWVLREIRLTLDPILGRQVALNRSLVRLLADQQQRIAELEERAGGGAPK